MVRLSPARREVHISVVPGTQAPISPLILIHLMSLFSSVADIAAAYSLAAFSNFFRNAAPAAMTNTGCASVRSVAVLPAVVGEVRWSASVSAREPLGIGSSQ